MMAMHAAWPGVFGLGRPMELRIDVQLPPQDTERELARRYERLRGRSDLVAMQPPLRAPLPGLAFRIRETDGDFHVDVEDLRRERLAGCTVFSRVPELGRDAGRWVRSPHSRYGRDYQRRGIASAVYRWALDAGLCLVSGPRQSEAAHQLWRRLAQDHPCLEVRLAGSGLACVAGVDDPADSCHLGDLETRIALLGHGWSRERFERATAP